MIIDSHQHFWSIARNELPWLASEPAAINQDRLPDDLRPLLRRAGVTATVLVQSASTIAETGFMLDMADSVDFVAGVVGWIDPLAVGREAMVRRAREHPLLRGFRIGGSALGDGVADGALDSLFDAFVEADLSIDMLIKPSDLPGVTARLGRTPNLRLVIDHAASPQTTDERWLTALSETADVGAWCKVSGLVNTPWFGADRYHSEDIICRIADIFGPRVMWGSDWPIVDLASGYLEWLALCRHATAEWTPERAGRFYGGAAAEFYGLDIAAAPVATESSP